MRFVIESSSSDDYGDYATLRIYFDEKSWLEIDAADAHDLHPPQQTPYGSGAAVTVHNADGTAEVVWNGFVMPEWYAKRLAKQKA